MAPTLATLFLLLTEMQERGSSGRIEPQAGVVPTSCSYMASSKPRLLSQTESFGLA